MMLSRGRNLSDLDFLLLGSFRNFGLPFDFCFNTSKSKLAKFFFYLIIIESEAILNGRRGSLDDNQFLLMIYNLIFL
jgi:hypothetical protein